MKLNLFIYATVCSVFFLLGTSAMAETKGCHDYSKRMTMKWVLKEGPTCSLLGSRLLSKVKTRLAKSKSKYKRLARDLSLVKKSCKVCSRSGKGKRYSETARKACRHLFHLKCCMEFCSLNKKKKEKVAQCIRRCFKPSVGVTYKSY